MANGDYIHSFKIENGCVSINLTQKFENPCGISYGLVTDPDNANILYTTGTYSNKICKIELNQGRFVREIKRWGLQMHLLHPVPIPYIYWSLKVLILMVTKI